MDDKFDVDADLVRKLAELLAETGLGEIEYEDAGKRIRVAMPGAAPANVSTAPITVPAANEGNATDSQSPDVMNHPGAVTSPMVGTLYVAPEPGEEPYVKMDDMVSEGQTLFLIEAMKTMNPIRAPRAGKVTRIFVQNATPVEYGEVLLIVE